jgi:hypothetical protein
LIFISVRLNLVQVQPPATAGGSDKISSSQPPNHDKEDRKADQHDSSSHPSLANVHGYTGAAVTAEQCASRHQQRVGPHYHMRD